MNKEYTKKFEEKLDIEINNLISSYNDSDNKEYKKEKLKDIDIYARVLANLKSIELSDATGSLSIALAEGMGSLDLSDLNITKEDYEKFKNRS